MTLLTVQIILGVLGMLTGLLIALFGPGSRWIRLPLALATGAGVAITAWPGLWVTESSPEYQLYQSLMLASVVVLMALLAIFLINPRKSAAVPASDSNHPARDSQKDNLTLQQDDQTSQQVLDELDITSEPGRDAININLEQRPDTMIVNQEEHAMMHMLSARRKDSANAPQKHSDDLIGFDTPTQRAEGPEDTVLLVPVDGETNNEQPTLDADTPTDRSPLDSPMDDSASGQVVSLAERRERRIDEAAADSLALSDSDELYEAMREAEAELEAPEEALDLPDDSSWLNDGKDSIGELNPDDSETTRDLSEEHKLIDSLDEHSDHLDIEDAEIIDVDNNDLSIAGATITPDLDLHDESSIAGRIETQRIDHPSDDDEVPATLQAALEAQRHSIDQLSVDTDTLAHRLSEWGELANTQEQSAWTSSLQQGQTVAQQNRRINAENNFRESAVELIHTQREVMRQLMGQITNLGVQRKKDLKTLTALQKNTINQRRLAREAALLARKAAAETHALSDRLSTEKQNYERAQGAAKRAIVIAREAVDKLAEHERRLGISSGRAKSDT